MTGFVPPPYPYDRLDRLVPVADAHAGGVVDLSIGTPCDPPPAAVLRALATSDSERGYPPSIGTPELRAAAQALDRPPLRRRRPAGRRSPPASGRRSSSARCRSGCGCARRTATPSCTRPITYPTYEMGAILAGCRAGAGARRRRLAASTSTPSTRPTPPGPCASGSTAPATRPAPSTTSAPRRPGAGPAACRCSATSATSSSPGTARPRTILEHGLDGVVAVHSLSKRSNLAGAAGRLLRRRPRAGALPAGGAQARRADGARSGAGRRRRRPRRRRVTSRVQRDRYRAPSRGGWLGVLRGWAGLDVALPAGRLLPVVRRGRRVGVHRAAGAEGGALVSPGEFYGPAGRQPRPRRRGTTRRPDGPRRRAAGGGVSDGHACTAPGAARRWRAEGQAEQGLVLDRRAAHRCSACIAGRRHLADRAHHRRERRGGLRPRSSRRTRPSSGFKRDGPVHHLLRVRRQGRRHRGRRRQHAARRPRARRCATPAARASTVRQPPTTSATTSAASSAVALRQVRIDQPGEYTAGCRTAEPAARSPSPSAAVSRRAPTRGTRRRPRGAIGAGLGLLGLVVTALLRHRSPRPALAERADGGRARPRRAPRRSPPARAPVDAASAWRGAGAMQAPAAVPPLRLLRCRRRRAVAAPRRSVRRRRLRRPPPVVPRAPQAPSTPDGASTPSPPPPLSRSRRRRRAGRPAGPRRPMRMPRPPAPLAAPRPGRRRRPAGWAPPAAGVAHRARRFGRPPPPPPAVTWPRVSLRRWLTSKPRSTSCGSTAPSSSPATRTPAS